MRMRLLTRKRKRNKLRRLQAEGAGRPSGRPAVSDHPMHGCLASHVYPTTRRRLPFSLCLFLPDLLLNSKDLRDLRGRTVYQRAYTELPTYMGGEVPAPSHHLSSCIVAAVSLLENQEVRVCVFTAAPENLCLFACVASLHASSSPRECPRPHCGPMAWVGNDRF
jgi:hypothetical protein